MHSELVFLLNSLTVIGALGILYLLVRKFSLRVGSGRGRYLELLERLPLNNESGLLVFRFSGKVYLAFYSKERFEVLKELKDEEDSFYLNSSFSDNGLGRDS